jgi:type II secretory pathway predicted ATPase ExeA
MPDRVDELIGEVARKHGMAIGRDDPILVLQTINERLLQDSSAAQQALLDAYKEELEALASRWSTDAADRADRILQAALAGSRETVASIVTEAAMTTAASVRTEVDAALARVAVRLQDARRIAIINMVAACITLVAAGIVVWSSLPSG